jgi:hypothetical protein
MQQQAMENAQDFYGQSLGRIKSQAQGYREQLEQYAQQLPEGNEQAQLQEMVDSYMELEGSMDQAAQDAGVEEAMNQASQQTMEQMQQFAQESAQKAQDAAGQAAGQAQQVAGQATDQAGQVAGQAQEAAGGAAQQAQDTAGQAAQQGQQAAGQAAQQGQQAAGGGQQQQQPNATQAAEQKAQELGVDLSQVQGSGAEGRITVRDVIGASNQ